MNRPSPRFMRRIASAVGSAFGVLGLAAAVALAPRADAASAVLSGNGTLYEVVSTSYGEVIPDATSAEAAIRVLALRTTPPGGAPTTEIVGGTVNDFMKFEPSIEFDEATQSVFIVYTRLRGYFSDVQVTIRRDGAWADSRFLPNPGLYMSLSPQLLATRQTYTDVDADGNTVSKSRSILSIAWWEESRASQARYAAVFIEDGSLKLDDVTAWNLNELSGAAGPTDNTDLPLSSYVHPGLQRDPGTNGGVLVSFANLSTRKQQVVRLSFPDDLPKLVPPDGLAPGQRTSFARGHTPIGRTLGESRIPVQIDLPFEAQVGTFISPNGVPTFFWSSDKGLVYLSGGSTATLTIPFRPDFPVDRAIAVVRDMSDKQ